MQISVLIPVYNAALYLQQAVESAIAQPETAEVILVEDGSTDNSLALCYELSAQYDIVKVYQHPNGENRGEAASRNLLVEKATCEAIAFLDADDYFLPDRFRTARQILTSDSSIDGVYDAVENFFENEDAQQRWIKQQGRDEKLVTMCQPLTGIELFRAMVMGQCGYLIPDCMTLRRRVFDRIGKFDTRQRVSPDTPVLVKMSAVCKIVPGQIQQAVVMRRIHDTNLFGARERSPAEICRIRLGIWRNVFRWAKQELAENEQQLVLSKLLWAGTGVSRLENIFPAWAKFLRYRLDLMLLLFQVPELVREPQYWKSYLPHRLRNRRHDR